MLLLFFAALNAEIGAARAAQGQSTSAQGSLGEYSVGNSSQAQSALATAGISQAGAGMAAQLQSLAASSSANERASETGATQVQNVSAWGRVSTPDPQNGGGSGGTVRQSSPWPMSAAAGAFHAQSASATGTVAISLQGRTGATHAIRANALLRDTDMQLFEEMLMMLVAETA